MPRFRESGRGKYVGQGGKGQGLGGYCICPNCGYKTPHKRNTPCYRRTCPNCGSKLTR